jgi:hypothetical protein
MHPVSATYKEFPDPEGILRAGQHQGRPPKAYVPCLLRPLMLESQIRDLAKTIGVFGVVVLRPQAKPLQLSEQRVQHRLSGRTSVAPFVILW